MLYFSRHNRNTFCSMYKLNGPISFHNLSKRLGQSLVRAAIWNITFLLSIHLVMAFFTQIIELNMKNCSNAKSISCLTCTILSILIYAHPKFFNVNAISLFCWPFWLLIIWIVWRHEELKQNQRPFLLWNAICYKRKLKASLGFKHAIGTL